VLPRIVAAKRIRDGAMQLARCGSARFVRKNGAWRSAPYRRLAGARSKMETMRARFHRKTGAQRRRIFLGITLRPRRDPWPARGDRKLRM
jgi:hypothetical protein